MNIVLNFGTAKKGAPVDVPSENLCVSDFSKGPKFKKNAVTDLCCTTVRYLDSVTKNCS
jgi:hypothetical protein